MYCAVVQGELVARQIDSGLNSAVDVKARAKEKLKFQVQFGLNLLCVPLHNIKVLQSFALS